ncbi:hypothetical protein BWQ96_08264 [Gracilariopsis chorda]|uniref:Uncharacterized protein n=1 Tax=Gracilariopsis chorda TaxID=448386 RepID=A0A2V3IIU1_9FLOR|nr:hypothetical protein BWQ96_08264 [Gracilariopsis chorda]|eukprot:PXF42014.1 hypothetical protein BWQ96_08264 [Gracilariopsis chorda]
MGSSRVVGNFYMEQSGYVDEVVQRFEAFDDGNIVGDLGVN